MKFDLNFRTPVLNAAGFLGFVPDRHGPVDLRRLGAFVTNPISLRRHSPATPPRLLAYPGGVLLHSGYPNPGLRKAIRRYASGWARSPLPVILHLLADDPEGTARAVRDLEEVGGLQGIELGLQSGIPVEMAREIITAALGELPLIVRAPPDLLAEIAWDPDLGEISGLTLGPGRGSLPGPDGNLVQGRLYGPGRLPATLVALQEVRDCGHTLIAAGGIHRRADLQAALGAGASLVQLDTCLWRDPSVLSHQFSGLSPSP